VDDLLDLSKLESGRAELNRRAVDSGRLVERVLEAHREVAAEKGIELLGEVHSDLPPTFAAPDEIGRVLDTLVSNALQFTDPSGRVVVSADLVGDLIQFAVADDGHEIPLEEQARIFDRFVPLARGRGPAGTGLGLAIARGIVRAHGGEIWVDSGPGPGCVFSFTLPIAAQGTAS
jgi:signal transduction histidine kinase